MKKKSAVRKVKVSYGARELSFGVSASRLTGVLENKKTAVKDLKRLITEALDNPADGKSLEMVFAGKRRVLMAVTDDTRRAHLNMVLPYLLRYLDDGSRSIKIIVATGMHKHQSRIRLERLLGRQIMNKYEVMPHGLDDIAIVSMGRTSRGVPITLDRNLFESGVVVSVGTIEPHLYAGYSGGAKTVAVGLAGPETINDTHGVRFLDDPLTAIGRVDRNPFQETLWEIASKTPLIFSVNVVNDHDGEPAAVFCGGPRAVFEKGVELARRIYEVEASKAADIVICGIGYPKDVNLYQASRALNYVVNVDRPVLRKGGVLIVAAEMQDGPGTSATELKFYDALRSMRSPQDFMNQIKRSGCIAGEHRTYMVAKALADYNVIFVTSRRNSFMDGLPFRHFATIRDALAHADTLVGGKSKIHVIPHSLATIARLR